MFNLTIYGKKLQNTSWMHKEYNRPFDPHSVSDWVYQMCSAGARSPALKLIRLPIYRISHNIKRTSISAFNFIILNKYLIFLNTYGDILMQLLYNFLANILTLAWWQLHK